MIGQKRVPMGVIGIIFEARPNVAADAFRTLPESRQCGYSARREGGLSDESGGDFRFARRIGGRGSAGGLRADGSRYLP